MSEQNEQLRAEFEIWASRENFDMDRARVAYESLLTATAWEAWQAARRAQPAPTVQAEPTDLSKRLRDAAEAGFATNLTRTDIISAADEIERYYGGMLNWKRTAEAKDAEIIRLRAAPAHASSDGRDAKDAERYRWLRDELKADVELPHFVGALEDDEVDEAMFDWENK